MDTKHTLCEHICAFGRKEWEPGPISSLSLKVSERSNITAKSNSGSIIVLFQAPSGELVEVTQEQDGSWSLARRPGPDLEVMLGSPFYIRYDCYDAGWLSRGQAYMEVYYQSRRDEIALSTAEPPSVGQFSKKLCWTPEAFEYSQYPTPSVSAERNPRNRFVFVDSIHGTQPDISSRTPSNEIDFHFRPPDKNSPWKAFRRICVIREGTQFCVPIIEEDFPCKMPTLIFVSSQGRMEMIRIEIGGSGDPECFPRRSIFGIDCQKASLGRFCEERIWNKNSVRGWVFS
jgi:hypothetical protein